MSTKKLYRKARRCLLCNELEISCYRIQERRLEKDADLEPEDHYCDDGSIGVSVWAGWKYDCEWPSDDDYFNE